MSEHSKIEWTDATWNPLRGCTKISPGCKHCYAETFAERFRGVKGHPYEQGFDLRLVPEKLTEPPIIFSAYRSTDRAWHCLRKLAQLSQLRTFSGFFALIFVVKPCVLIVAL
jgi:protein gp37